MKYNIEIEGMSCQHCVNAVREALQALGEIHNLFVDIGKASFESEQAIETSQIQEALEEEGYRLKEQ